MAQLIPSLSICSSRMTSGERRFAQRLEAKLESDYLVWYDVAIGPKRRYPDFIVLHPGRGLLLLEVKDWKIDTLKSMSKAEAKIICATGLKRVPNPLEQARQYCFSVVRCLGQDQLLQHESGKHQGKLAFPYGYGVVLTNITRRQLEQALGVDGGSVLPEHLVICKDEMSEAVETEAFQTQLWNMFTYQFGRKLSLPQIDRIRGLLFPEIRIDQSQAELPGIEPLPDDPKLNIPDVVKVMDLEQERLARNLGQGHRVVHGVAGSGKTLILAYRCRHLAKAVTRPILVLCFNIALAAKLRSMLADLDLAGKVHVHHFHEWCSRQLKTYHVDLIESDEKIWERQVSTVIRAVERGQIPRAQYDAVMIDEGHDFEADWLRLSVQMVNPATNSLLLLYDDAQSIYKKRNNLEFSLSSVGVQARGRTTVLKLNYRNTREILQFAYGFAKEFLQTKAADEDHVPLIEPEMAGVHGVDPQFRQFNTCKEEIEFIVKCVRAWHQKGEPLSHIGLIYVSKTFAKELKLELKYAGLPTHWLSSGSSKKNYDPKADKIALVTRESSKGLEFERVIVCGLSYLKDKDKDKDEAHESRLLYVAMTRATRYLVVTCARENRYQERLLELSIQGNSRLAG